MTEQFFSIAGLKFKISSELTLDLSEYSQFSSIEHDESDAEYIFSDTEISVPDNRIFKGKVYSVYEDESYTYRKFSDDIGGFVLRREKSSPQKAVIFGCKKDILSQQKGLLRAYLALEEPLLANNTFILHSSIIKYNEKAIVFTGPSQIGKSTQARLWQTYMDADVLNGDRTCVEVREKTVNGYGSFFSGSSGIYRNEGAEVCAIVVLGQSKENSIKRLSPGMAFFSLYSQTLNNPWNKSFVQKMTDLLNSTVSEIPVYKLDCLPDTSAVEMLFNELFSSENNINRQV